MSQLVIALLAALLSLSVTHLPGMGMGMPPQAQAQAQFDTLTIEIVEFTNTGRVNNDVTLTIRGLPQGEYSIRVILPGGQSRAAGVSGDNRTQTADTNGLASWTWRVGAVTPRGSHDIIITRDATGEQFTLPLVIE